MEGQAALMYTSSTASAPLARCSDAFFAEAFLKEAVIAESTDFVLLCLRWIQATILETFVLCFILL